MPSKNTPSACVAWRPCANSAWLTSFIITSWLTGASAIRCTSASNRSSSSAAGGASTASPHSCAVRPSIRSPVNRSRLARWSPTRNAHSAEVGTPQTRAGGYPMRASSAITSRSAHSAMSVPPATQNPCTLADDRLVRVEQAHEAAQVPAHHLPVHHRVPRLLGVVIGRLRLGVLHEVVPAAEALAVAGQRDHVHGRVEVRLLDAVGQLPRHLERDRVRSLG